MTGIVKKGKALREDLDLYDGLSLSGSRTSSSGGTTTGNRIGDWVDVLMVYGGGSSRTSAAIQNAIDAVGSNNVAFLFSPGTWSITSNVTIPSNVTCFVSAGAVFNVSGSVTLTIQGVLFRMHTTYSSGAGTVTASGKDILASYTVTDVYAADTGVADAYVINVASNPGAYAAGQVFRFKATYANTGASTINVDSLGVKSIVKNVSTALSAGDINAGEVITIAYDGTNFQMVPTIDAILSSLGNVATQNAGTGLSNSGANLNIDLSSLAEETTVDKTSDEIFFYDNSASATRKIPPDTFRSQLKLARIVTGTYTGDGSTSNAITGLGFQPLYIKIWKRVTTDGEAFGYFETTDTIIDDDAQGGAVLTNNSGPSFIDNRIKSLDSDGFTVDDDGSDRSPNENGTAYNYLALG